ncbi:hypothetical protein C6A36_00475 [Desulfobacteraceae bacterium SEEP-SAG10]|nr:hypothetical protein C6A36_00475 [Desulfobacteraceae bacterium SEEP-SAG10]
MNSSLLRVSEKINYFILLVFWLEFFVAPTREYVKYAPVVRLKFKPKSVVILGGDFFLRP